MQTNAFLQTIAAGIVVALIVDQIKRYRMDRSTIEANAHLSDLGILERQSETWA